MEFISTPQHRRVFGLGAAVWGIIALHMDACQGHFPTLKDVDNLAGKYYSGRVCLRTTKQSESILLGLAARVVKPAQQSTTRLLSVSGRSLAGDRPKKQKKVKPI